MDERLVWRQVTIPKGLSSLLSFISKETIVQKPDCVYSFIAQLLEEQQEQEVESERSNKGEVNERTEETHLLAAGDEDEANVGNKLSSQFNDDQINYNLEDQPPTSELSQVSVINEDLDTTSIKKSQESPIQTQVLPAEAADKVDQNEEDQNSSKSFSSPPLVTSPQSDLDPDVYQQSSPSSPPVQEQSVRTESAKIASVSPSSPSVLDVDGAHDSRPDSEIASKFDSPKPTQDESELKLEDEPKSDREDLSLSSPHEVSKSDQNVVTTSDVEADELDLVEQLNTKELSDLLASGDFSSVSRSEERLDDEGDDDVPNKKDDDSEELSMAATRIQAGFRGYQARKGLKNKKGAEPSWVDETANDVSPLRRPPTSSVTRRQGSGKIRNSAKYRSGMIIENDSPLPEQLSLDEQYLSQAATKIQANVRGYLTRRNIES